LRFDVVTIFPEVFDALRVGITGRAIDVGLASLHCWNPRDYADDQRRTVDDRPYGGGPGMIMKVEPTVAALRAARQVAQTSRVIYLTPQGRRFDQSAAQRMSQAEGWIFLAGRYEGIDERLVELEVDEEWSVGDYVLSGGELPAMLLMDAMIRLLPGALGHEQSAEQDSHVAGLLDCPHYTRPEVIEDLAVPAVLLGGDHDKIRQWRLQQALGRTWLRRPDLLEQHALSAEETTLLNQFIAAQSQHKGED
jgi:tRNA (guanine37-N1)-methyltransferase